MTTTSDAKDLRRNGQLEAERIRAHLRQVVRESKLTRKVIAERAGLTLAVLSNILREGGPGLYVTRVFHIFEAVGADSLEFYGELYPETFERTDASDERAIDKPRQAMTCKSKE